MFLDISLANSLDTTNPSLANVTEGLMISFQDNLPFKACAYSNPLNRAGIRIPF